MMGWIVVLLVVVLVVRDEVRGGMEEVGEVGVVMGGVRRG